MTRNNNYSSDSDNHAGHVMRRDVAIIGGGPAGVAAAVQLKRGGLDPLLFECDRIGGLLHEAFLVENYPGLPEGIAGSALAGLLDEHLVRAGIEVVRGKVIRLDRSDGAFSIDATAGGARADTVIVASGTKPMRPENVRIEDEALDRIGYGVRGLGAIDGGRVAVIGGGDAAFDYALNLSRRCDVVILHRSSPPRCIPVLRERCGATPRISYMPDTTVNAIAARGDSIEISCRAASGDRMEPIAADRVVVAIGREPCLDFLGSGVAERISDLEKNGILYLIGDVANGPLRQAAISAGDGVRAAMEILSGRRAPARRGSGAP